MNFVDKLTNARIVPLIVASGIGLYHCHSPAKDESLTSKIKRIVATSLHTLPILFEIFHATAFNRLQKQIAILTTMGLCGAVSSSQYKNHVYMDRALRIVNLFFSIHCFYFYYSLPFNQTLDFFLNLSVFTIQLTTFIRSLHQKYHLPSPPQNQKA